MAAIDACYISCGCNRTPHCADWGQNNIICYGSCRAVVICQPETSKGKTHAVVLQTLYQHTGNVNCVKWIPHENLSPEMELVSGSVDKTIVVWKETEQNQFVVKQILSSHSGPVTSLCAHYVPHNDCSQEKVPYRTVIASTSADASVKIWSRYSSSTEFVEIQNIKCGSGFTLDVALITLPNTDCLMLALACDDHRIHIYVEQDKNGVKKFLPVIVLPGHEDWVRALDFTIDDSGDILLASAAQDYMIRVWRFSYHSSDVGNKLESILDLPLDEDIQMIEKTFAFTNKDLPIVYAIKLETVLSGHENWIYSVKWKPPTWNGEKLHQDMCLLSVSMDKTMILWSPDSELSVWTEQVRVGEVGGNTLGFYGGMFGPKGNSILAHGYQGAFHQWDYNKEGTSWSHAVTVSGHFDSVEDIEWDRKEGAFLLSCSLDETVRLHAPWVTDTKVAWYEIARPQVHGYALQCIAMVTRYKYASGADEKVVRIFDAPDNFVENFCYLCRIDLNKERQSTEAKNRPVGASVPALGLSNKAVFADGKVDLTSDLEIRPGDNEQYGENVFTSVSLKTPPSEEHLLQNTLWPEIQKLYGHGYEVFAVACDPQGNVLASSCKATKAEFASVILWDTVSWQQLHTLEGHNLTVTQIAFSHTGEFLLTVSRDRTWYLYKRKGDNSPPSAPLFSRVANVNKKTCVHARIIWSCCWTYDDKYFATASRDKKVVIWQCPGSPGFDVKTVSILDVNDSVTAVDSTSMCIYGDQSYMFTVGLDNGIILLYKWTPHLSSPWQQLISLDNNTSHHLTVKRLKFRPCLGLAGYHGNNRKSMDGDFENWLQLASCSCDHSVKVYNINLLKLREQTS